jgi:putative SOS response-associated peptidase YedK
LSRAGIAFLRVHQHQIPEDEVEIHEAGRRLVLFAGLWRRMPGGSGEAFTILTTEPGPDVTPIHNRQVVVLDRKDGFAWLDLTCPEAELLQPLPAGSLTVKQIR